MSIDYTLRKATSFTPYEIFTNTYNGRRILPAAVSRISSVTWQPNKRLLVGCFGFNGPLRQYFSLYRAVSQREGERRERIDESKNVQTTPTRTYCKRNRPLPYCNQSCRTPRHWKFTQHHRTTRPPPRIKEKWPEICVISLHRFRERGGI